MPGRCRWLSRITNGRGADHCSRMDLGVSATKIVVSVLSLPKVGFGPPIVGHYPSAFSLAYLVILLHINFWLYRRVFKKWLCHHILLRMRRSLRRSSTIRASTSFAFCRSSSVPLPLSRT